MKTYKETIDHALDVVHEVLIKLESIGDMSRFPLLYEEDDKVFEILNILESLRTGLIIAKGESDEH